MLPRFPPLVALVLALPMLALVPAGRAAAQDADPEPYFAFSGLYVDLDDSEFTASGAPGVFRAETSSGFGASATLGAASPGGLRAEAELALRLNDVDRVCGATCAGIGGDAQSLSLMLNGVYDVPLSGIVRPYAGIGVGMSLVSIDLPDVALHGDDGVFAYQVLFGVGWRVARRTTLVTGYRYFRTLDPEIGDVRLDYQTHNVEVGFRVGF